MIADPGPTADDGPGVEPSLIRAIQQLPGVLAASVWLAAPGRLRALHITAAPRASGLIIANAAAQLLRRIGLAFESDMIRVAFRDGQESSAPSDRAHSAESPNRFLVLDDLAITRIGSRVTCRVTVRHDNTAFEGEATELDTEAGRVRAAARATLAAAERADHSLALGLEGTTLLDMFGRRYVAASVEAAVDRRFAILAGLVPIDPARSPEEASCLATLRAVDRWILL
jgi:hypothetical protein